jgi:hypothetical protein
MYVYKGPGDGFELRMSLRSVAAHMRNVERVALVGSGFPDWLSDDVVFIPCPSPFRRKQMNILLACLTGLRRLGTACLYSSDDHMCDADCDADDFPWFSNGEQKTYEWYVTRKARITPYRGSLAETHVLLRDRGYPCDLKMSGHFNTHMDAKDADEVEMLAGRYWDTLFGYEPSELFAAVARRRDPSIRTVRKYDGKLMWPAGRPVIEDEVRKSSGFFSTSEFALTSGDLRGWLAEKYPDPCRWERRSAGERHA